MIIDITIILTALRIVLIWNFLLKLASVLKNLCWSFLKEPESDFHTYKSTFLTMLVHSFCDESLSSSKASHICSSMKALRPFFEKIMSLLSHWHLRLCKASITCSSQPLNRYWARLTSFLNSIWHYSDSSFAELTSSKGVSVSNLSLLTFSSCFDISCSVRYSALVSSSSPSLSSSSASWAGACENCSTVK